jgi:phenylacetic acid degradation operon negative regulatory protein
MKKLLRPKDALLLGLAGVLDIYEDFKDPLGLGTQEAKKLYGWVPGRYKHHNFRRVIERSIKTGDIEKVIKNNEVYLRLTSVGKETIVRDYPLLSLTKQKWDGKWRVVIFDIAEINKITRNLLRARLKELGFGMLQESVWVTPHNFGKDITEFFESQKLDKLAFLLEVTTLVAGDRNILTEKIWHLQDLNDEYKEILKQIVKLNAWYVAQCDRTMQRPSYFGGLRKNLRGEKKEKEGKKEVKKGKANEGGEFNKVRADKVENKIKKIRAKYLQIFLSDPCLPKELLPEDWVGEKVKEAVLALSLSK